MPLSLIAHADGKLRCSWCGESGQHPDYVAYHDAEWGHPQGDERRLFEKLCLEGFQAGLSWITVLRKRDRYREVFFNFDAVKMAAMTESDVLRLLADPGIIRHRGKVEAAIHNARCLLAMQAKGESLAALVWSFEPGAAERPTSVTPEVAATLAQTPQSQGLSKALRQRGFKFVGPTTMYALMQSMGVVNDHLAGCALQPSTEQLRQRFKRPKLG